MKCERGFMLTTYEKFIGGAFVLIGILLFLSNAGAADTIIKSISLFHMSIFGTLQGRDVQFGDVKVGGFANSGGGKLKTGFSPSFGI